MPKIRRRNLPEALLRHLSRRVRERAIAADEIVLLAEWLDKEQVVPEGKWYRRFPRFTLCGEGELIKTFLLPGQAPDGVEIP